MAGILSPTQERREEIVQNAMQQVEAMLEFEAELDEDVRHQVNSLTLENLGALAIALEAFELEAEETLVALDANIQLCVNRLGELTNVS